MESKIIIVDKERDKPIKVIKDFTYDLKQYPVSYLINTVLNIMDKHDKLRIILIEP